MADTEPPSGRTGVRVADARAAAARGGVRAGDCIVRLNGAEPRDVLDVEDAAGDGSLWMTVLRDGRRLDLVVKPRRGEWHGVSLDHDGLGDAPMTCRNACRFCFVDQVPRGLREALYVKDDDYRLSFLHGNFMTLSNLGERELRRIENLRLSPLYVSLHAWDDEARARLMGKAAAGSRAALERLAAAGLDLHLQVVLCPGWNDGAVLEETVHRAAALTAVRDLGIVPVSLAAEGDLRRCSGDDAEAVIASVAGWQRDIRTVRGEDFVHAADELYLAAGADPPPSDAPEQYENGVGIVAALLAEAGELSASPGWSAGKRQAGRGEPAGGPRSGATADGAVSGVRLLTGVLAQHVVGRAADVLAGATRLPVHPFAVENDLFGTHVTVTGLLGGAEVLAALRRDPLGPGEWLVVPRVYLPSELGRTLDDVGEDELAAACGGRLVVAASLTEAFATLSR